MIGYGDTSALPTSCWQKCLLHHIRGDKTRAQYHCYWTMSSSLAGTMNTRVGQGLIKEDGGIQEIRGRKISKLLSTSLKVEDNKGVGISIYPGLSGFAGMMIRGDNCMP